MHFAPLEVHGQKSQAVSKRAHPQKDSHWPAFQCGSKDELENKLISRQKDDRKE